MLLDLQGAEYHLYDPEIATTDLLNTDDNEAYFCCGNLSFLGIEEFNKTCLQQILQNDKNPK